MDRKPDPPTPVLNEVRNAIPKTVPGTIYGIILIVSIVDVTALRFLTDRYEIKIANTTTKIKAKNGIFSELKIADPVLENASL